jgi:hypothetical protein
MTLDATGWQSQPRRSATRGLMRSPVTDFERLRAGIRTAKVTD